MSICHNPSPEIDIQSVLWLNELLGGVSTASTLESGSSTKVPTPSARLVVLDLRNSTRKTLARGGIHRLSVSADERFLVHGKYLTSAAKKLTAKSFGLDTSWGGN
jgi:hypothetical protein